MQWIGGPEGVGHVTRGLGPALLGGEWREGQREHHVVERNCVLGEEEGDVGNDKFMVTDCYLDTLWKQQEGLRVGNTQSGRQAEHHC